MTDNDEVRELLIAAGVDPDTEDVELDSLNAANANTSDAPEQFLPRRRSTRDLSPVSPDYDQNRTPWTEADRNLIF